MEMGEILGLVGVVVSSVIGPIIVIKQRAAESRATQMADAHVANSDALSKLVVAVELLHTKIDAIQTIPCNAPVSLPHDLHILQSDIAVIKDRGQR